MKPILHDVDYYSLVFYFAKPPICIDAIIRDCCDATQGLIGSTEVEVLCGLGTTTRTLRGHRAVTLIDNILGSEFSNSGNERVAIVASNKAAKRSGAKEFLWLLDYQPDPIDSIEFEPTLGVHFGIPFLTEAQALRLRSFSELLADTVVEHADLCHALADVGAVGLTGRGGLYHSQVPLYVPLDRLVRRRVWLRLGEQRKRKLRGVFWGQVLSVWMVEQLGGPDRFLEEYRLLEDPVNTDLARTFPDGSMFVCLSNSPLDVRPPNPFSTPPVIGPLPPMIDRAVWLHERFTEAGLL